MLIVVIITVARIGVAAITVVVEMATTMVEEMVATLIAQLLTEKRTLG
jgi:hypothetical protein